ncbi:putative voltage-gated proton channel activity [Lyophyllum shimeji]|uniref:Voltage-gated proton channel activity n=1 Tax=Lyophyllum shimeji TaxID=47721 RepID=A0A9P3UI74_LYOSH|nr:putative voltage-gated proton channel activity [Lyophyllum shimeji]
MTGHYTLRDTQTYRQKTAQVLDSRGFHLSVITLIAIDAICVLIDLGYAVLSPECGPVVEQPPWLEALAHTSLGITSFLMLEIPLATWAFGPGYYNPFGQVTHAPLHFFDAVIIVTTFVLEAVLRGKGRELAGLLIVLRLWRLVELVGGVAVGAGELEEEDARKLADTLGELQRKLVAGGINLLSGADVPHTPCSLLGTVRFV